jgi:hypothetical protein
MDRRLPPHNQRRLNCKIAEIHGDRYADWFDLACELQNKGATYAEIALQFSALGIKVSQFAVRNWMLDRKATTKATQAA